MTAQDVVDPNGPYEIHYDVKVIAASRGIEVLANYLRETGQFLDLPKYTMVNDFNGANKQEYRLTFAIAHNQPYLNHSTFKVLAHERDCRLSGATETIC